MDQPSAPHVTTASHAPESGDELLLAIRDEVHQTHETARAILRLLVPKEGDREGPSLEELLATLIVQQREMLSLVRQVHADVQALRGHDDADGEAPHPPLGLNGRRRQ